jgi:hypothetical protein
VATGAFTMTLDNGRVTCGFMLLSATGQHANCDSTDGGGTTYSVWFHQWEPPVRPGPNQGGPRPVEAAATVSTGRSRQIR